MNTVDEKSLVDDLNEIGFDSAMAFATEAEITSGGACGQLAMITED
jgi:hypothetical protein